ncbi:MAG: bacillithiol biosynthesis deacetylase BshB2 [Alicyclobacillus sp.]|nr:bacillithiol biosynthesis deacetylase BshB2 [Alicyclobacillus sp.]
MNKHVVVVYPHPDDESFGKAGTLALFTRAGTPVTLVCGTLGQMGRNMGKPFFATRESLPRIREQELRDACAAIGIQDLRLLGLRDKTVEFEDPEELADRIEAILRELQPDVVITHYPGHGVHPDHNALAYATVLAVGRLPKDERPTVYGAASSKNAREVLGPPDVVFDVRDVLETKFAAIRAHRSQSEAMWKQTEARMAEDESFRRSYLESQSQESFWTVPVDEVLATAKSS